MAVRLCAFCRNHLRVYPKKTSSWINIILSGMLALFFHFLFWDHFDPRGFLFWVVFGIFGEIFVQFRWRLSVVCKCCGFDPVVYLRDSQAAVAKVKAQLEFRKNSPLYALAPPLQLPKISKTRFNEIETELANLKLKSKGHNLALRI